jgi:hypothetical protein
VDELCCLKEFRDLHGVDTGFESVDVVLIVIVRCLLHLIDLRVERKQLLI